ASICTVGRRCLCISLWTTTNSKSRRSCDGRPTKFQSPNCLRSRRKRRDQLPGRVCYLCLYHKPMIYIVIYRRACCEVRPLKPGHGRVPLDPVTATTAVGVSRIGQLCGLLAVTLGKKA